MWTAPAIAAIVGVFLGLVMLITGLGGVINPLARVQAMREFAQFRALQLLAGFMAFTIGAAVVTMVPLSDDLYQIIVTFLGWMILIKGGLLLVWGDGFASVARLIGESLITVVSWTITLLGAILFIAALQNLRGETAAARIELSAVPSPTLPASRPTPPMQ